MKKIIFVVFLALLVIGCAQVSETAKEEAKEPVEKQETQVKEEVKEPEPAKETIKEETEPEPETEETEQLNSTAFIKVGETETVQAGGKKYDVKLVSLSNRARFSVNSELTRELLETGTQVLKDGATLHAVKFYYNEVEIKITPKPEKELVSTEAVPVKDGPVTLMKGVFRTVEKETAGYIEIIKTLEGDVLLTFSSFQTEPGPGLYVYLVDQNIDDGFKVKKLYSREGNQQYDLPKDIDLSKYKKVVIYSESEQKIYGEATAP